MYKICDVNFNCSECGSERHSAWMHTVPRNNQQMDYGATLRFVDGMSTRATPRLDGGEQPSRNTSRFDRRETYINNIFTTVCGDSFSGRSCAKTVLINVYYKSDPNKLLTLYAIVNDQSKCTIARSELFDYMHIPKSTTQQFTLSSCAGRQQMSGRRASGFFVSSIDGSVTNELSTVTECFDIPDDRSEIPTPDVVSH